MFKIKWFLPLCVTLLCSSCSWLNNGYSVLPLNSITNANALYGSIKTSMPESKGCFAVRDPKDSKLSPEECASQRNYLISVLMAESVNLCSTHLNSIYGNEAAWNIATGSIAGLAAVLATVSTGNAVPYFAGLSAFATTERALVNETVYKSMLTTAIGTKIREMREQKGKYLLARKKEPFSSYGMEEAIQDVLDFHEVCSFRRGLEVALAEGTNATTEQKRQQLEARAASLKLQIQLYIKEHENLTSSDIELDDKGAVKTKDPILKDLVEQFMAISHALIALNDAGTKSKESSAAAAAAAPAVKTFEGKVEKEPTAETKVMTVKNSSGKSETFDVSTIESLTALKKDNYVIVTYVDKDKKYSASKVEKVCEGTVSPETKELSKLNVMQVACSNDDPLYFDISATDNPASFQKGDYVIVTYAVGKDSRKTASAVIIKFEGKVQDPRDDPKVLKVTNDIGEKVFNVSDATPFETNDTVIVSYTVKKDGSFAVYKVESMFKGKVIDLIKDYKLLKVEAASSKPDKVFDVSELENTTSINNGDDVIVTYTVNKDKKNIASKVEKKK